MTINLTGTDTDGVTVFTSSSTWITLAGELVANDDAAFDFDSSLNTTYLLQGTVVSSRAEAILGPSTFGSGFDNNHTVSIASTGVVQGGTYGVQALNRRFEVLNDGSIFSEDVGVSLSGNNAVVLNSGTILSTNTGVEFGGFNIRFSNTGTIQSVQDAAALIEGSIEDFRNFETLSGRFGLRIESQSNTGVVQNFGLINGNDAGISINGGTIGRVTVENWGTIQAAGSFSASAITGDDGRETILNEGIIRGSVVLGAGADTYRATNGTLTEFLELGSGDDSATLGTGALSTSFSASGGSGQDRLDLGQLDIAIWLDMSINNGFWTRDETDLDSGTWRNIGSALSFENIVDTLGADMIMGDTSDDIFVHRLGPIQFGIDRFDGGGGSDTYDGRNAPTALWIDLAPGAGSVWTQGDDNATDDATADTPWQQLAITTNFENVIATLQVDFFAGNAADNTYQVQLSDTYYGTPELVNGRGGSDTADLSRLSDAVWVDLGFDGVEVWTQGDDSIDLAGSGWLEVADLTSVENVIGTNEDDYLIGNGENNILEGDGGDDILIGRGGADTFVFSSGFGNDTIVDFNADDAEQIHINTNTGITSFTDLVNNHLLANGGSVLIEDDDFDSIVIDGYDVADFGAGLSISADDFVFFSV